MPKVTIDDFEFNTEDLCDEGKDELARLQLIELQLGKLKTIVSFIRLCQKFLCKETQRRLGKFK